RGHYYTVTTGQPYPPRPYNVNVNVPTPPQQMLYRQPLQITSGNTGNRNEYAGRNDQPRQGSQDNRRGQYQPNRPYQARPQPAYHGETDQPDDGYTGELYAGEYHYDYGGDLYQEESKGDTSYEQANHAHGDAVALEASDPPEQPAYNINYFQYDSILICDGSAKS
ncbi:MAG: hypothetical protein M1830_005441, partial [Pleopsidium flavum]